VVCNATTFRNTANKKSLQKHKNFDALHTHRKKIRTTGNLSRKKIPKLLHDDDCLYKIKNKIFSDFSRLNTEQQEKQIESYNFKQNNLKL